MSGIGLMMLGPFVPTGGNIAGAFDLDYAYYNPGNEIYYPDSFAYQAAIGNSSGTAVSFNSEVEPMGGFFIDPTGTYLYITGDNSVAGVSGTKQYTMSTTWDVSTANSSTETTISPFGLRGIWFKADGTMMFLTERNTVTSYDLGTAWDISTYTNETAHASSLFLPGAISGRYLMSPDGTKGYCIYTSGSTQIAITQFTYTTAWDISSISSVYTYEPGVTGNPAPGTTDPPNQQFYFNSDGTILVLVNSYGRHTYSVSTAYDLSSTVTLLNSTTNEPSISGPTYFIQYGSYRYTPFFTGNGLTTPRAKGSSVGMPVYAQSGDTSGVFFKPDGTKMFVSDYVDDKLYTYNLSSAWNLGTIEYQSGKDLSSINTIGQTFFKPDGTQLFISTINNFYEYALGTAWDLSTATLSNTLTAATIGVSTNTIRGIFMSADGTRLIFGTTGTDAVRQVTLSTAWDLGSTPTLDPDSINVTAKETAITGAWANTDGTKIFVYGTSSNDLHEYDLGTAWDLSTASFSKTFNSNSYIDTGSLSSVYNTFFIDATGSKLFVAAKYAIYSFGMQDRGF